VYIFFEAFIYRYFSLRKVLTRALKCLKTKKPYTRGVFEPWTKWSGGGSDDHYTTPPGHLTYNGLVCKHRNAGSKLCGLKITRIFNSILKTFCHFSNW
jgi:hypothetical protein